jgi:hypothetical protein
VSESIEPAPFTRNLIRNLYRYRDFEDSFQSSAEAIDVIIPLLHSTDLWEENLKSYYREIPISRLHIGNAGAIDGSVEVLEKFPRVVIHDHSSIKTLGKSLAQLIDCIETTHFIYLQSDVYLPSGWYNEMLKNKDDFEWFGCPMQMVTAVDTHIDYSGKRPLVGAQMGKRSAFEGVNNFIGDDYVYRTEEFVLEQFVEQKGLRTGSNKNTFHFHQAMRRETTGFKFDVKEISVVLNKQVDEERRVLETQAFSIIKYCKPIKEHIIEAGQGALNNLMYSNLVTKSEILKFTKLNGPDWLPYVYKSFSIKMKIRKVTGKVIRFLYQRLKSG